MVNLVKYDAGVTGAKFYLVKAADSLLDFCALLKEFSC